VTRGEEVVMTGWWTGFVGSVVVVGALGAGCADDADTCVDSEDCSESEVCISFDDDPNDNVIYAPTCAKICTSNEDCASGCCADGLGVCAPSHVCR